MEFNFAENIGLVPTAVPSEQLGAEAERKLTTDINDLWSVHVQAQNTVATTNDELKVIRQRLGERLHQMKLLLARPGRNGQWSPFLQGQGIPRTTADRPVARHERSVTPETNCASDAIHEPTAQDIEKLFTSVWPRLAKTLTTPDSLYDFVRYIMARAHIPHEYRGEGILMFRPTFAAPQKPRLVSVKYVPSAEPANCNYGAVV